MTEKKQLRLHVFVWALKTGELPNKTVDHIDRDPLNNQFENLRLATMQQQQHNKCKLKSNTTNFIGVCHHHVKLGNGYDYWCTWIRKPNGKREAKTFPFTETGKIEAAKYYDKKAKEYFGEFHGELNFPDDNKTA